ncbi:MAG: ATPase domain-containing protein [Candidatus ainarchaeum sp.]|nr:ATPase domain-containing protein [Candidatus ainarchaeum sp.]
MERIKTGISGLDDMLQGGLPKNKHVALYGGPGCGKSSFGFEFLYRGALQGENGMYVTLEETAEDMVENMKNTFSQLTDIDSLMKAKKLLVVKPDKLNLEETAEMIEGGISDHKVKRVVIDSATMVRLSFEGSLEYRQTLFEFFSLLRGLDCTVMMTIEASSPRKEQVVFDIEHFVMDGIINLYSLEQGDRRIRALEIFKMRGTDHSRELVPFKVTPAGIKIYVGEKVF